MKIASSEKGGRRKNTKALVVRGLPKLDRRPPNETWTRRKTKQQKPTLDQGNRLI
jgi:hypothetical protein